MATAPSLDTTSASVQVDLGYVNANDDACVAWLRRKYATIPAQDRSASSVVSLTNVEEKTVAPRLATSLVQKVENDVLACDELRWRPFAFPSHPTQPLNPSYSPKSGNRPGSSAIVMKVSRLEPIQVSSHPEKCCAPSSAASYTFSVGSRISKRAKARAASRAVPPSGNSAPSMTVEEMLEKVIMEERLAQQCRALGEENIRTVAADGGPVKSPSGSPKLSTWASRTIPLTGRPLLGGYVSAPSLRDSVRFLIFPQSSHPVMDTHDVRGQRHTACTSHGDPQSVSSYVRGTASLLVEENNPATRPTALTRAKGQSSAASGNGLHHCITYARRNGASSAHPNWVDAWEASVAHRQPRTERQYVPERAKVQRLTLLEDSVTLKASRGDPRYATSFHAGCTSVPGSGARKQHSSAPPPTPQGPSGKPGPQASTSPLDDAVLLMQWEDAFDSSTQYFELPSLWQRWLKSSSSPRVGVEGSEALAAVPRGLYRMRVSGGPGVEMLRAGDGSCTCTASSFCTIFARLWMESWLQLPLAPRWTLTLRNQSAAVVPLHMGQRVAPFVPSDEALSNGYAESPSAYSSWLARGSAHVSPHPYFWATQSPRWSSGLLRGFADDYERLHHARTWYSVVSAELKLESGKGASKGPRPKRSVNGAEAEPTASASGATGVTELEESGASTSTGPSRWRGVSLTGFANACMVDTVRAFPRASIGLSFVSKIPRFSLTPYNDVLPSRFECSLSWFAALRSSVKEGATAATQPLVHFRSGLSPTGSPTAMAADGTPFMRVSPVETFHHIRCGVTWRFDDAER